MKYLQRSSNLGSLQRPQICRIARLLLTSPRINWTASQPLRRPFNSGAPLLLSQPPRTPRSKYSRSQAYNDKLVRWFNDSRQPPPRADGGKVLLGTIVIACTLVYGWHELALSKFAQKRSRQAADTLNAYQMHMVLSLKNIREGRYYTLLTSTFAHGSLMHLGFNMVALWSFGQMAITLYGIPIFATLYVGSAVAGGMLEVWYWDKNQRTLPGTSAVGASGSIFGVFAALSCALPRYPMQMLFIPMPMWVASAIAVGVSMRSINQGWMPGIGHADHLGGMAFGAFWWLIAMRRGRVRGNFMGGRR